MKMKKMFLYIIGILGFSACDFLETDVFDDLSETAVYNDQKSCEAGLAGVYDPLTDGKLYGGNLYLTFDAGSDLMIYNKQYSIGTTMLCLNNYSTVDTNLKNTWYYLYTGINRANDFIVKMTDKPADMCGDERNKKRLLAEAKGLRALYYMNLVSYWGDVPLRLQPTASLDQQKMKRSPQIKVYEQIISDLEVAATDCLAADEWDNPGHITQTTALALLARTYMWMSGYPVYADKWKEALECARKVRDSGLHELVQAREGINGYQQLFMDMCADKYNVKESMFEIEMYGNDLNITRESGSFGLSIGITQGCHTDPDHGYCYGFYDGTKILFRMYEDTDARKWWNFPNYSFREDKSTGLVEKVYRTENDIKQMEDGNAAKWRREYEVVRPLTQYSTSINVPVMRYSDVLLMIAEAANEVNGGPTQEAEDAINEVRSRAGASKIKFGNYDLVTFRELVRDERARELCFEGNRKMDLRRWGKDYYEYRIKMLADQNIISDPNSKWDGKMVGYSLLSGTNTNIKAQPAIEFQSKHIYFPIPEAEMSTNTLCSQNEGW